MPPLTNFNATIHNTRKPRQRQAANPRSLIRPPIQTSTDKGDESRYRRKASFFRSMLVLSTTSSVFFHILHKIYRF